VLQISASICLSHVPRGHPWRLLQSRGGLSEALTTPWLSCQGSVRVIPKVTEPVPAYKRGQRERNYLPNSGGLPEKAFAHLAGHPFLAGHSYLSWGHWGTTSYPRDSDIDTCLVYGIWRIFRRHQVSKAQKLIATAWLLWQAGYWTSRCAFRAVIQLYAMPIRLVISDSPLLLWEVHELG